MKVSRDQLKVLALAAALVVSAVVITPGMLFGPSGDTSEAKSGEVYTQTEVPQAGPDAGSFESASLMSVPDGYTSTTSSGVEEPPDVRASAGAQTMQVSVTEDNGEVALQLEDDRVHDGRWVSIPSQWFENELGSVPEVAYVAHKESGEEYQTELYTRDDSVAFYVEEFSTNTVTFSGEVNVSGDFEDGSQAQYELSDLDSTSDPVVNLTGETSTEDEVSTGTAGPSSSSSLSIAGNVDPTGPSDSTPKLSVTAKETSSAEIDELMGDGEPDSSGYLAGSDYGTPLKSEHEFTPNESGTLTKLTPNISDAVTPEYDLTVDVYIVEEGVDEEFGEGTRVKEDWTPEWSTGEQPFSIDDYDVTAGETYTIEFVSQTTGSSDDVQFLTVATDSSPDTTLRTKNDDSGDTFTYEEASDIGLQYGSAPKDLSVSSAIDSATLGDFESGEMKTTSLEVPRGDSSLEWSGSGGDFDWSLNYTERTQTEDPSVELNSETVSHSGTLDDGETVQLNLSQESLREGTNYVNVSVGDGTLSSDAPTPMVGMELTHDAVDKQDVEYGGGQWTETYNVSETYASSRSSANLTVPFQTNVYQMST